MNLSHRRLRVDLILTFKILNELVDIDRESSMFKTYSKYLFHIILIILYKQILKQNIYSQFHTQPTINN